MVVAFGLCFRFSNALYCMQETNDALLLTYLGVLTKSAAAAGLETEKFGKTYENGAAGGGGGGGGTMRGRGLF